jgi:hypothetical protein
MFKWNETKQNKQVITVKPETKFVGKEVHVNLIAVVGVAPTIPIRTFVLSTVYATSIVPFGAADARVQRVAARSALVQPKITKERK